MLELYLTFQNIENPRLNPRKSIYRTFWPVLIFLSIRLFLMLVNMSNTSSSALSVDQFASVQFWLEGVLTPVVSMAGLIGEVSGLAAIARVKLFTGNTVCILVLTIKKKDLGLKPSFIDLLTLLVINCGGITFRCLIILRRFVTCCF